MTEKERNARSDEILVVSDLILYLSQIDANVLSKTSAKELVFGWFDKRESEALRESVEGENALKSLKEVSE